MEIKKLDVSLEFLSKNSIVKKHDEQFDEEIVYLERLGFADLDVNNTNQVCRISPKGMMFFLKGGFKTFKSNNELKIEDIDLRIKMNKWYYKHKWLPYILSIVAIIVSIISILFTVRKE